MGAGRALLSRARRAGRSGGSRWEEGAGEGCVPTASCAGDERGGRKARGRGRGRGAYKVALLADINKPRLAPSCGSGPHADLTALLGSRLAPPAPLRLLSPFFLYLR